jgi:hypothetical protein
MNPTPHLERRCVKEVIDYLRAQAEAGNLQRAYEVRAAVKRRFVSPDRARSFARSRKATVWQIWYLKGHWNDLAVFEEPLAASA